MIRALFGSRKFVLGLFAIAALVPLVIARVMTVEQFGELFKWIVVTLIAAIGAEGVAEKWNAPPPPTARAADSLKPPPLKSR